MTCGKNADGGNGVTIGRISKVVSEETGCSSVLRSPNDLPISGSKQEFENFLEAADVSIIVVLHAFKCGDVLDAACGIDTVKTVLVLGGTDVNVDALSCADNLLTLKRRANAVDAIVAFSDSMVTAAPDGTLASDKVTVIAQGVRRRHVDLTAAHRSAALLAGWSGSCHAISATFSRSAVEVTLLKKEVTLLECVKLNVSLGGSSLELWLANGARASTAP